MHRVPGDVLVRVLLGLVGLAAFVAVVDAAVHGHRGWNGLLLPIGFFTSFLLIVGLRQLFVGVLRATRAC